MGTHKIFCLMGKSASGKDTIYRRLGGDEALGLRKVVPYTTRPMRDREEDGREYFFTDEAGYRRMEAEGRVIEMRAYDTACGLWRYFTADDGQIDLSKADYLLIGTPESFTALRRRFGDASVVPVYIRLDDGERLQRALKRERRQEEPHYEEMCRRFLADAADFSEEKLREAGIDRAFDNGDGRLDECVGQIRSLILERREEA